MTQKLNLIWDQKYGTFYQQNWKISCLLHYWKRKLVDGPPKKCPFYTLSRAHLCFVTVNMSSYKGTCWIMDRLKTKGNRFMLDIAS